MKIFVTTNDLVNVPKNYLILSPNVEVDTPEIKRLDIKNICLDAYAEDGELEELVLDHILEYIPLAILAKVTTALFRKVRHGGVIIVNGIDGQRVARDLDYYRSTIEQFNEIIHGNTVGIPKTTTLTTKYVDQLLQAAKFEIIHRRLDEHLYSMKAKRP